MADWNTLVEQHHLLAYPDGEHVLVKGASASQTGLANLEETLGFELPMEFRSFYSTIDGFGTGDPGDPDDVLWFFRPCAEIGQFCTDVRLWFQQTHGGYAERFFPFIDWVNGDGIGYLLDESGAPIECLFEFSHEQYRFDLNQDVSEFLRRVSSGIEEFLRVP